jgi:hypothetical protein
MKKKKHNFRDIIIKGFGYCLGSIIGMFFYLGRRNCNQTCYRENGYEDGTRIR